MFLDQLEELDIFLDCPISLIDVRIEMIVPLLSAMIEIPKVLAVWIREQSKGNHLPVVYLFTLVPVHNPLEDVEFLFDPVRWHRVLIAAEQFDLVSNERHRLRCENRVNFRNDVASLNKWRITNSLSYTSWINCSYIITQTNILNSPKAQFRFYFC